ncbi:FtsQ-type POTRA domain-containing protein [Microbacterium sp. X-17]
MTPADEQPTAPIPPLLAFARDALPDDAPDAWPARETDPAPPAEPASTEPEPEPEPAPVGWREVWRAARARRRAMRAEVRRFTVRQRRRRAVWLGAIGSLVLLVAGSFAAAYSPLFAVEEVSVVGTQQLDAGTVAGALSSIVGTPLPLVDESAVKAALVAFPLVESYTLEARPPHELVVRIVERTPVGVIASPSGYTLVDAAGVALSTTPTAPPGYPTLSIPGGVGSDAFAAAGTVLRSLPADLRSRVADVTASSPDDVAFTLTGSGARIVWGSADQSARKSLVLQKVMADRPPAPGMSYDVSSPEAVVVG